MNPTVSVTLGHLAELARLESGTDRTDKGSLDHNFLEIYEKFFFQWIDVPIRILEIGVYDGGSLGLWYDYFTKANIFGIDIYPKTDFENNRIKTFVADQANREQLQKFIDLNGGNFDIIIDDGGHGMEQQQVSLGFLFPFINQGGYYIIEDLHTSLPNMYPEFKATRESSTLSMIENFSRKINIAPTIRSPYLNLSELEFLQNHIDSITTNTRIRGTGRSITSLMKKK